MSSAALVIVFVCGRLLAHEAVIEVAQELSVHRTVVEHGACIPLSFNRVGVLDIDAEIKRCAIGSRALFYVSRKQTCWRAEANASIFIWVANNTARHWLPVLSRVHPCPDVAVKLGIKELVFQFVHRSTQGPGVSDGNIDKQCFTPIDPFVSDSCYWGVNPQQRCLGKSGKF
jgi:hypothetical protein